MEQILYVLIDDEEDEEDDDEEDDDDDVAFRFEHMLDECKSRLGP